MNKRDPKGPNFESARRAALIAAAVGLTARLVERSAKYLGFDYRELKNSLSTMSDSELEQFVVNLKEAGNHENEITEKQLFGLINPDLLTAATIYDFKKDAYNLERGLSDEQKSTQKGEEDKGKKAKGLIDNFSGLAEGTYKWNGKDWVLE
jgi:hypothetical protein